MKLSPVELLGTDDDALRGGERRRFRQALAGTLSSGLLHAGAALVCGLAALGAFDLLFLMFAEPAQPIVLVAGVEQSREAIELTMTADPGISADDILAEHVAAQRDWSFELVDHALAARDDGAALPEEALAAKWVEQASDQSQARSAEENLNQLDELGGRLTAISSKQAVGDIGNVLSRALNLEERATAPEEMPAIDAQPRKFENSSAQLHDVRLEQDAATGTERFVATLVDRHGTSIEMEMDPASGRQAYDVMQTIKKYPLLESVYRAVVMKILDRLIEPAGVQGS